jgi:hypothetical protein
VANTLSISKGKFGREVDTSKTIQLIKDTDPTKATTITAAVASPGGELNDDQVEKSKARAEKYIGKSIKFSGSNNIYSINDKQMVDFLVLPDGYNNQKIDDLLAKWKDAIDRKPQTQLLSMRKTALK